MKLTTKDLIKILPLDEEVRKDLMDNFDNLESGRKYVIENVLWEYYDTLFDMKIQENMQLAIVRAQQTNQPLGPDLTKRVREETEKQLSQENFTVATDVDLSHVRSKLQDLMKKETPVSN